MRQNDHQLSIVARKQPAWYIDRTARYCDGFVEIESAPVCGERGVGGRILGWLPAVENQEAILELRAVSRQPVADSIQARLGSRGYAGGLQLRNESFAHLSFSGKRIIIVVRSGGLLGIRKRRGGQEEKKLHRNSVRLKVPRALASGKFPFAAFRMRCREKNLPILGRSTGPAEVGRQI